MTRLNELASRLRNTQSAIDFNEAVVEAVRLLEFAAAETVGTEWTPNTHPSTHDMDRVLHNADISAARVRIAAVEAERYAISRERDDFALTVLTLNEQRDSANRERDAALASLSEKQRAIDEAWDCILMPQSSSWIKVAKLENIFRPHATPTATAATPAASPCGKPTTAAQQATPADDTRELIARLANEVSWLMLHLASKDRPAEWRNTAKNIDTIITAARKGPPMRSSDTHAVCRGCGRILNGKPFWAGGSATHPVTGRTVPVCHYGGYVCSEGCDVKACLELEQTMPGHGTSQKYVTTAARARINRNWKEPADGR